MENLSIKELLVMFGTHILFSLIILFIGFKATNLIIRLVEKALDKRQVDHSLKLFLSSVFSWLLKISVVIAAANTAGIETTSFVALLGTAGLAIGMALQGSLSNFAGGVLILLLKPFKVGDVIKAQGFVGKVDSITTFSTYLRTPDNQIIVIPNGGLANSAIINVNQEPTRRVDFTFSIGYEDDIDQAKNVLKELVEADNRILKEPEYAILVSELADSSVNIVVRTWTKTEDYWGVFHELTETVKKKFDQVGITIPFPQSEINVKNGQTIL